VVTRFDLATQFSGLGEGIDIEALFAGITVTMPDRGVTVTANDGTTATVALTGSLVLDVTDEAARAFVGQLLQSQGLEVTEEILDQYTPLFMSQLEVPKDMTDDITMAFEDGAWLVCDDFGGGGVPSPAPAPSGGPEASLAPMDPAALGVLMAAIPLELQSSCTPDSYWQVSGLGPDPGEIAAVECNPDGSGGIFATFSLFADQADRDAAYDLQLEGQRAMGSVDDGPGCPLGPGAGSWQQGQRFCFAPFGIDAGMWWTYDDAPLLGSAMQDDADWEALEAFFRSVVPDAP
jgi:hypothetical protein